MVDTAVESLMQAHAIADLAPSAEMDIGDLDDFHGAASLQPDREFAFAAQTERTERACWRR
jgi:hypothetical protein